MVVSCVLLCTANLATLIQKKKARTGRALRVYRGCLTLVVLFCVRDGKGGRSLGREHAVQGGFQCR